MDLIIKKQDTAKISAFIDVKWANITSIFALIVIFGKGVLTPKKLLCSFLIALIFIIGSLAMVPYYFAFGSSINLSLFLISSFIYGSIFYSFRKSTLFDNIRETNLSKMDIYFSIFIIMFIFTAIDYLFIISFFIIGLATNSNLFMDDWFFSDSGYGSGGHLISELNAQLMVWWFVAFILLNFSLFYLFQNIAYSQKTFYLFVFLYLTLLMLYGNSINTPYLGNSFVIVDKYPILTKLDNSRFIYNSYSYSYMLMIPNYDYPFDASFYLTVSDMLKPKFEKGNYFSAIMTLLTPHYWINIYSANVMKATSLKIEAFNPEVIGGPYPAKWNDIIQKINDFEIEFKCSPYTFGNALIWSFKNEISWILGMYLWIAYFIFYASFAIAISKIKQYNL